MAFIIFKSKLVVNLKKKDFFLNETQSILNLTSYLWPKAKDKRFLFTGCTGFFGIWLIKAFIEADKKYKLNCKIYILTRNKKIKKSLFYKKINSRKLNFIFKDILNFQNLNLKKIDYIVHGATTSALETYRKQSYKLKYSIIVDGTKKILKFAKKIKCSNFFYMSSGAVYGYSKNFKKFREDKKIFNKYQISKKENDITILGKAKLKAERMVIRAFKNTNCNFIIARFFSFLGPFMPLQIHYAISNFLKNLAYRENIILSSSGASIRSYMYIKDCIVWLIILMFQSNKKLCNIYNVGSDKQISILSLAKKILKLKKNSSKIIVDKKNKNFNYYVPDISKFKNNFKIPKNINLDKALKKTLFHISNNPKDYFIK